MKIEYSTVYGRFYRGEIPLSGKAVFIPLRKIVRIDNSVLSLRTLRFMVENGELLGEGTPGVSIPASTFGIPWEVSVAPMGYSNVIQSYPGDIISLGD